MRLFIVLVFFLVGNQLFSQNSFIKDIDFVYKHLKRTKSYKTQKVNQIKVDSVYQHLTNLDYSDCTVLEQYIKLYQLLDQVCDYHNEIYGSVPTFNYSELKDSILLQKVLNDSVFPFINRDLDSLKLVLHSYPVSEIKGVYSYKDYVTIGVRLNDIGYYEGVVLESLIPTWRKGEIMMYLIPLWGNRYRFIGGHIVHKRLISAIETVENGVFGFNNFQKIQNVNHSINGLSKEIFYHKSLNENTDYLKLGSFSMTRKNKKLAIEFYNIIKNRLSSKYLIVDLRNNSGGGDIVSKKFFKLLKKYRGNIYVLINFRTGSNAERFVVRLMDRSNVKVMGQPSKGSLTYGRNYGKSYMLPSGNFRLSFSDMKDDWRKYLPYEGKGIVPDVFLSDDFDWVEAVLGRIKRIDSFN